MRTMSGSAWPSKQTEVQSDMMKDEFRVVSYELIVEIYKYDFNALSYESKSTRWNSAFQVTSSDPRVSCLNPWVTSSNSRVMS